MDEPRKGRQPPTQSVVLPYMQTYGQEAIDLYNSTGRTAQKWQEIQMYELTREVREHNNFAKRMPVVEKQIKVINHRIEDLWGYHKPTK